MKAYFDTSVLAPLYLPEAFSEQAHARMAKSSLCALSWLCEVEYFSVVAHKLRTKSISRSHADRAGKMFMRHLASGLYVRLALSEEHFVSARQYLTGFATPLRTLDALHIACCEQNGLTLVTADKALAKNARHFGVRFELIQ